MDCYVPRESDTEIDGVIFDTSKGRSEDFKRTAEAVSSLMNQAGLDTDRHNELVDALVKHVTQAEKDAFEYGFVTALRYSQAKEQ